MPRAHRRNPTATEIARDVVRQEWYLPDFLGDLADALDDEADRVERAGDPDTADALVKDSLLLRALVKKHRREFSE